MDDFAADNHAFTIRIWREEVSEKPKAGFLRGHITHVPSGRRQYFQALDEIAAFIRPYVADWLPDHV